MRGDVAPAGVEGHCDPAFAAVGEVFAGLMAGGRELGAAVAVYADGRPVVDLWGGVADSRSQRPWTADTVAMGFSVAKGAVAALCCRLAQEGVVDLDEHLSRTWPELRGDGKEAVTLRWVLSHRAGLPAVRRDLDPMDLVAGQPVLDALAAEPPWWEPGTAAGYHPFTYGFLAAAALRGATGRSLGALLDEHVAAPLGLDLWIGLPDEVRPRVARLEPAEDDEPVDRTDVPEPFEPGSLPERAFANPPMSAASWNAAALLRAEIPAVNAVGSARAWARLYAACVGEVDGVRLLDPAWLAAATTPETCEPDLVQDHNLLHVGLGFRLPAGEPAVTGPGWFGHGGSGGALAGADRDTGVAFAYLPNRLRFGVAEDGHRAQLVAALRDALGLPDPYRPGG